MFSSGDKGQPIWNGSAENLAHYQAVLSAVETALQSDDIKPTEPGIRLRQELELAKQILAQAIAR